MTEQRRLAAIVSADVAGYSRLMGRDESGTLVVLKELRKSIIDPAIAVHGGRIVKTTGDGLLLEFPSVVGAVRCVIGVQSELAARTAGVPGDRRIEFRIGVNLGDIIIDSDDIFGDGVNVAARLQELAAPGGICVSSRVHEDVRDRLDTIFEDGGVQSLKNIARPVQVWHWKPGSAASSAAATPVELALPDRPSIAVLPFQNISGDPEQEYFVDGIAEDIITDLSRFRQLFVIARNSTFIYKSKSGNVRQIARELGVRYVLEGSSRRAADRVRVTAQLIDCETGSHIWAERYDRDLSDIFVMQEEITRAIVGSIAPAIEDSAFARARRNPPANLTAHDIAVRAWWEAYAAYLSGDGALRKKAIALAQQALALDPECVRAFLTVALVEWQSEFYAGRQSTPDTSRRGLDAARRATALDRLEHRAYIAKGLLHLQLAEYDDALADLRKACDLNPNDALALISLAYGEVANGDGANAKGHLLQALRLSPRDPMRYGACAALGNACFLTEDYEEGLQWLAECKRDHPGFRPAILIGIKLHVGAGQIDRARSEAERAPRGAELVRAGISLLRRPEHRERELRFLRIAYGLPADSSPKLPGPP